MMFYGVILPLLVLVYLPFSIWLTQKVVRKARREGKNAWLRGGLTAFIMYNLVLWNWIPTHLMHKYYCETQAGFFVYKTPEQWDRENPGVLETLVPYTGYKNPGNWFSLFNDRFASNLHISRVAPDFLSIERVDYVIVDIETKNIVAREVDFMSGPHVGGDANHLTNFSCFVGKNREVHERKVDEFMRGFRIR